MDNNLKTASDEIRTDLLAKIKVCKKYSISHLSTSQVGLFPDYILDDRNSPFLFPEVVAYIKFQRAYVTPKEPVGGPTCRQLIQVPPKIYGISSGFCP